MLFSTKDIKVKLLIQIFFKIKWYDNILLPLRSFKQSIQKFKIICELSLKFSTISFYVLEKSAFTFLKFLVYNIRRSFMQFMNANLKLKALKPLKEYSPCAFPIVFSSISHQYLGFSSILSFMKFILYARPKNAFSFPIFYLTIFTDV